MRGAWAYFSARQLLWTSVFVLGSGILLLVPLFVGGQRVPAVWVSAFRSLHSAASFLLVVGALGHGVARAWRSMTPRAATSGILASVVIGLAALTGLAATTPETMARQLGMEPDRLESLASVFHFGYSAAILFVLVFWHVRPSSRQLLPAADRTTAAQTALILVLGLVTFDAEAPSLLSRILVPGLGLWAVWTLVAPLPLWAGLFRRRGNEARDRPGPGARL